MSQKYRFKSLEIAEKEKEQIPRSNKFTVFDIGETRTIDFVLLDGTRQNFAYAHYLTAWLGKDGGNRVIKIFFATHLVTIKGYCLGGLYDQLIKLSVKSIKAHDERYTDLVEEDRTFVTDIKITWKKEEAEG
ncbi:MAG: hypothetical protein AAGC64_04605 [Bacteroidota bacterium]